MKKTTKAPVAAPDRQQVNNLVERHGPERVAQAYGLSRQCLAYVCAGWDVHNATRQLVEAGVPAELRDDRVAA